MPSDIRNAWQRQAKGRSGVSPESIRRKTSRLEETMRQQAVNHLIAALILVLMALYISWQLDEIFFRLGAGALIVLAASLAYRARKVRPAQLALNATPSASLAFYRQELEQQISYLRAGRNLIWPVLLSVAFFLTPFVRGAMGRRGMRGFDSRESIYFLVSLVGPFATMMVVWVGSVFVVVGRKIRDIQREIGELDTLRKESR